jgi:hypothetical protein
LSILLKAISITGDVVIQSGTSPGGKYTLKNIKAKIDAKITESGGEVKCINYHGSFYHGCMEKCHNFEGCDDASCACRIHTDFSEYHCIPGTLVHKRLQAESRGRPSLRSDYKSGLVWGLIFDDDQKSCRALLKKKPVFHPLYGDKVFFFSSPFFLFLKKS